MCSLEGTLQSLTAALTAANAREHNLSVEVHRLGAASTPVDDQPPARQTKVDARTLGKPDMFTSEEHKWQDWVTVVSAYCSVVDLQMGVDAIATGASTNLVNRPPGRRESRSGSGFHGERACSARPPRRHRLFAECDDRRGSRGRLLRHATGLSQSG